jgi:hypothetical protein
MRFYGSFKLHPFFLNSLMGELYKEVYMKILNNVPYVSKIQNKEE